MTMSRNVTDELKQLSRNEGVTLFMTCLAAYQILLGRFTGQQDFLIALDVANRTRVETEGLISSSPTCCHCVPTSRVILIL